MRPWSRSRSRSFIWARPLRERRFARRFWVYSALMHIAAFTFLRSDSFDLSGRGRGRPAPARSPARASAPFETMQPLEVIEIAEAIPEPLEVRPSAREELVEPKPLDVNRALRAVAPGAPTRAVSAEAASATGGQGGAFTPPVPLAFRWPEYPEGAPPGDGPTTVVVKVHVGSDGNVVDVELGSGAASEVLNRKALEVARGMRFSPARREGRAVDAWFELPVTFNP